MSDIWLSKKELCRVVPLLHSTKARETISDMHLKNKFGILLEINTSDYRIRKERAVEFITRVPALTRKECRKLVLMFGLPVDSLG